MPPSATRPKRVTIYTDGACVRNPGPGGYGVVVLCDGRREELSGGFRLTTNNRMELVAAIEGLRSLTTRSVVTVYSDSKYVVDAMAKGWAARWRSEGWTAGLLELGRERVNADLWRELLDLAARHAVTFQWVKGHAGNVENERCDALAMRAAMGANLPADEGYERARIASGT